MKQRAAVGQMLPWVASVRDAAAPAVVRADIGERLSPGRAQASARISQGEESRGSLTLFHDLVVIGTSGRALNNFPACPPLLIPPFLYR